MLYLYHILSETRVTDPSSPSVFAVRKGSCPVSILLLFFVVFCYDLTTQDRDRVTKRFLGFDPFIYGLWRKRWSETMEILSAEAETPNSHRFQFLDFPGIEGGNAWLRSVELRWVKAVKGRLMAKA